MVVSKRCKICTVLDADNIPISGEYFGKLLPDLIVKISGIEMDPRKANGVLICQSCAIQLIHTGTIVDKLRNTLQRLKKLETKSKTPSKVSTATQLKTSNAKDSATNNGELQNTDRSETGETVDLDVSKTQNEMKSKTPKKIVRRKSVYPEEIQIKNEEETKQNGETDVSKSQNKSIRKTPNQTVRQKSVFPDDKLVNSDEESGQNGETSNSEKSESGEITFQTNFEESKIQTQTKEKSKKAVRRKSIFPDDKQITNMAEETEQNGETPNTIVGITKFKKIIDSDLLTPIKKMSIGATKRKLVSSSDECLSITTNNPSPMKRNKTKSSSVSEESPMNCAVDEKDGSVSHNEAKVMNCIICGRGFNQKASLREHIETSHMGERLKACPHCSSEFRSQQKYELHVFSEKCKNAKHACQYPKCNKRFKSVHKMEIHMQEKHSSQNEQEAE